MSKRKSEGNDVEDLENEPRKKSFREDGDQQLSESSDENSVEENTDESHLPPMPRKKNYRQRAHCNPLSINDCFDHPESPDKMDWAALLGPKAKEVPVEFADIGCGYGGLLMRLAPMFPNAGMVGMEIRFKVSKFVQDKIVALRARHPEGTYDNVCCVRTNTMRFLRNFFHEKQLTKMFFLFPDPHFKKRKHKWRIIAPGPLLDSYAEVLRPDSGRVYTLTDVEELHEWMVKHLSEHSLFERLSPEEMAEDVVVGELLKEDDPPTEEGQKVRRAGTKTHAAVFRRLANPKVLAEKKDIVKSETGSVNPSDNGNKIAKTDNQMVDSFNQPTNTDSDKDGGTDHAGAHQKHEKVTTSSAKQEANENNL
ncbi:putative methyltransferase domain-containing protein [Ditylenchus destructor]|uniref:tRNA (guanine-N(7)-)-methyltransferase n=1 Tax=Ditylenchus destructor TaxID=166010 RepID=A0AAD4NAM7_9BILA|nr:putative methyltransferase domain-containing protein [Ditylenchus destructor]